MRKYFYIFKTELMSNLNYVFNVLFSFIGYFIHILVFFYLWNYIYSDSSQIINGYSKSQMIWYVIITEVIWSVLAGRSFCRKISEDVKSGNITYNLNKPYSYIGYLLSSKLGEMSIGFVLYFIGAIILGLLFLGSMPNINVIQFIIVLISCLLASIISVFLIIAIGLFAFYIEDTGPFYWVYSKVILIFGTIFPIDFFPKIIRGLLSYSPIYVVSYGPAKLFVNFNYLESIKILIAQIIYIIITYLLCLLIYKKGEKRLNVNGG